MADVTKETLDALAARLTEVEGYLHIDERRGDVANLEAASAAPGFWDDAAHARDVMARLASAKDDVAGIEAAHAKLDDALAAYELGCETEDEDLLAESAELVASLEKDSATATAAAGPSPSTTPSPARSLASTAPCSR